MVLVVSDPLSDHNSPPAKVTAERGGYRFVESRQKGNQ